MTGTLMFSRPGKAVAPLSICRNLWTSVPVLIMSASLPLSAYPRPLDYKLLRFKASIDRAGAAPARLRRLPYATIRLQNSFAGLVIFS